MTAKAATLPALVEEKSTSLAVPSYLTGKEVSGLGELGAQDFKIPRIKLLQAMSPECREHPGVAIPGDFWHTGLNISMGSKLEFTPLIARKRVIVWRPQTDNGGGMLAFSADGKTWQSGGNTKFEINIKNVGKVIWDTKQNVAASKLMEWGSSVPTDPESAPAATMNYEYLCFFEARPDLSPAVYSVNKTALPRAKQFNTALMLTANRGIPIYASKVALVSQEESSGSDTWFVPSFRMNGFLPEEVFKITKAMQEKHNNYAVDLEDDGSTPIVNTEY